MERQRTLGSKDLLQQVKLPAGASEEEWLALTTVDMFNEINLLAGAVQDICTAATCPMMNAGPFEFMWADETNTVPQKLSAPEYFETLLLWVDRRISDEKFLPIVPGVPFPPDFRKGIKLIYKRLFRIYAHIFHSHYKEMVEQEADAHLKHSFKHFIYFVKEFDLVGLKDLEPLQDLVALCMESKSEPAGGEVGLS